MKPFEYASPGTVDEALSLLGETFDEGAILAGGTDLLTELKDGTFSPSRLVDVKRVSGLDLIEERADGILRIGATAKIATIAEHPSVLARYAALAQAARETASPQIRNMATVGGSLCQRPRCWYYRSDHLCLRKGGANCLAVEGENRFHAILGGSPCYIVHPSDLATALVAFDASVRILGPGGERPVPILPASPDAKADPAKQFYVLPKDDPYRENTLQANEIVTGVRLPKPAPGVKSAFVKVRERGAFDFSLAAAAVAADVQGGKVAWIRCSLGAVAPAPWRAHEAEAAMLGKPITLETAAAAAEAALAPAKPMSQNRYKIHLAKVVLRRAIVAVA